MADDRSIIARLSQLPVAIVSDVLRHAGRPHQVLHHSIQALAPPASGSVAGRAFCVQGERVLGGHKQPNLRGDMYRQMPDGSIVVMASSGYEDAVVFGENVAVGLHVRGCRAIVTDGGVRDRVSLCEMNIPVFARFVTPLSSGAQWTTVALDQPILVRGQSSAVVRIEPGDIVVGDADGVVIVPYGGATTVAEDAERLLKIEDATREQLLTGADPDKVYADNERFGHIRRIG